MEKKQTNKVQTKNQTKKKNNKKKKLSGKTKAIIIISVVLVIALLAGAGCGYIYSIFGSLHHEKVDESDIGINGDIDNVPEGITNIALFGVDSRDMNTDRGRSDAMIVVSVDTIHNKIKFISFERDTYIAVEGYGHTKLTHAYAYGGHSLAMKTLNQNFDLDIRDFVSVNFSQLANIIDYIGGVVVNVTEAERQTLNKNGKEQNNLGIKTDYLAETGDVLLSGGQALAYARDRSNGTDFARMDRQYEVILAMAESVKKLDISKYDDLLKMILSQCKTSLEYKEIIPMGYWALRNNPSVERITIPNDDCHMRFETIDGLSYVVYDIPNAKNVIHKFIES